MVLTSRASGSGSDKSNAFLHFKFATHMSNVHRVSCYDMTLEGLRAIHRRFHCPPGPVSHNFACRLRFVPRRRPRYVQSRP